MAKLKKFMPRVIAKPRFWPKRLLEYFRWTVGFGVSKEGQHARAWPDVKRKNAGQSRRRHSERLIKFPRFAFISVYYILLPLVLGGLFCAGCTSAKKRESETSGGRIKILSTIAQIENLVSEIGGERVESLVLVRGELNPHTYELVKGDDEKIQSADVIFYNGLGLEHGASVSSMIYSHPGAFALGESIQARFAEKILWKENTPDPHIWMDISLWKEAVIPIAQRLSQKDPEGEMYYRARSKKLLLSMEEADRQIRATLQAIPPARRYLVTSHDAFSYFARSYLSEGEEGDWEKRFAAPEGLSPEGQLNPADLQKILDHLNAYQIEVLFPESNVSRDSIRKLVDAGKRIGLKLRICDGALYGDSFRGSYLDAMKHNAQLISKSLNEKEIDS